MRYCCIYTIDWLNDWTARTGTLLGLQVLLNYQISALVVNSAIRWRHAGLQKLFHPAIPTGEHGVSLENMGNMENMENMEKMENMEMFSGSPTEMF